MYQYSITIPIRSALQSADLAKFQSVFISNSQFCGHPIKNLECRLEQGKGQIAEVSFDMEAPVAIEFLRNMAKQLVTLELAIKWVTVGETGLVLTRAGSVYYEAIIGPEVYDHAEACLI